MSDTFTIRSFQPTGAEYEAVAAIEAAVFPDNARAAATFRHNDAQLQPGYLFQRLVVEQNDAIVGYAYYREKPWAYVAGHYQWGIYILPEQQGKGMGTAVYDTVPALREETKRMIEKL